MSDLLAALTMMCAVFVLSLLAFLGMFRRPRRPNQILVRTQRKRWL